MTTNAPDWSDFPCVEWDGYINTSGYGQIQAGEYRGKLAHRVAWERENGPIPDGMCVCHHCDNRRCVEPRHLFLGTHADNMADMVRKDRACKGDARRAISHPPVVRGCANPKSKLSPDEVLAIRARLANGESKAAVARAYGVSDVAIGNVARRKTWGHVPDPEFGITISDPEYTYAPAMSALGAYKIWSGQ